MTRRVLFVAFHFPPFAGSSGAQRTLRFLQHLPKYGWEAMVLTVKPMAYEQSSPDLLGEIPAGTVVRRALALNAARHLSLGGRYLAATARPDRWASWRFDGVRQGLRMVRALQPDVIWSTYPIPTAHVIAGKIAEQTGLPWVADFRDPMAQEGYPADPVTWRQFKAIEEMAVTRAAASTFTTPGAVRTYQARYPASAERISLIENGYDEESFVAAEAGCDPAPLNPGRVTLLHSGVVYPEERDPQALFRALAALKAEGGSHRLVIRFRASSQDGMLRRMAEQFDVVGNVEIMPSLPYIEALREMQRADALLVLQAGNCNEQIPAKLYEYLR